MVLLRITTAVALGACWPGVADAVAWHAVPGAPEVQIALGSLQLEGPLALVWLRMPGRSALTPDLLPGLAAPGTRAPRIHRTTLHAEFDCSHGTLRVRAATAHDGSGTPLAMTSTPGRARPVEGGEMGWTYDAVCEVVRSERRF